MTMENSSTSPRTPSAEKNADGLTLPPDAFASTDTFISALADEMGPEFRELTDTMSDGAKRQLMFVALQVMVMDSEQLARVAKLVAADLSEGGAE